MSLLFRGLTYLIPSPFFEGVCLQLDGTPCGRCAILTGFFGVTGAAGFGAARGAALGAGVDLGFGVFFTVLFVACFPPPLKISLNSAPPDLTR